MKTAIKIVIFNLLFVISITLESFSQSFTSAANVAITLSPTPLNPCLLSSGSFQTIDVNLVFTNCQSGSGFTFNFPTNLNFTSGQLNNNTSLSASGTQVHISPLNGGNNDCILHFTFAHDCSLYNGTNLQFVGSWDPSTCTGCTITSPNSIPGQPGTIVYPIQLPSVRLNLTSPQTVNVPLYSFIDRYYEIVANSGSPDYFVLTPALEADVNLINREVVDASHNFISTLTSLTFDNSNIQSYLPSHNQNFLSAGTANDRIYIHEVLQLITPENCLNTPQPMLSNYTLEFHCDHTSSSDPCIVETQQMNVRCQSDPPIFNVQLLNESGQIPQIPICPTGTYTPHDLNFVVTNNTSSTTQAGSVEITGISFGFDPNLYQFSNLLIDGNLITGYTLSNGIITISQNNLSALTAGVSNGLTSIFDPTSTHNLYIPAIGANHFVFLPEGHTFHITLTDFRFIGCNQVDCNNNPYQLMSRDLSIFYNDQCAFDITTPNILHQTLGNLVAQANNNFRSTPIFYPSVSQVGPGTGSLTPNVDLILNSHFNNTNLNPFSLLDANGNQLFNCPSNSLTYSVEVTINTNYIIDFANLSVSSPPGAPIIITSSNYSFAGGVLTITIPANSSIDPANLRVIVPLVLTCGANVGSGTDNFPVRFVAHCPSCNCDRDFSCSSISVANDCGGGCPTTITTTNGTGLIFPFSGSNTGFTAERTTFGWVSESDYLTNQNRITATSIAASDVHELQKVYPKDNIHLHLEGHINPVTANQIDVNIEFDKNPSGTRDFNDELIDVASYSTCILSFPGTGLSSISANPVQLFGGFVINNSGGNFHTRRRVIQFTLPSSYQSYISSNGANLLFEGDLFINTINTNQQQTTNYPVPDVYPIILKNSFSYNFDGSTNSNLTTEHFGCDPADALILLHYIEPRINVSRLYGPLADFDLGNNYGFDRPGNSCHLRYALRTLIEGGVNGGDDFPLEFRPVLDWKFNTQDHFFIQNTSSPFLPFVHDNSFDYALTPWIGFAKFQDRHLRPNNPFTPYFQGAEEVTLPPYLPPTVLGSPSAFTANDLNVVIPEVDRVLDKDGFETQQMVLYIGRTMPGSPSNNIPGNGSIDISDLNLNGITNYAYSENRQEKLKVCDNATVLIPCSLQYNASLPSPNQEGLGMVLVQPGTPITGLAHTFTQTIQIGIPTANTGYAISNMFFYLISNGVTIDPNHVIATAPYQADFLPSCGLFRLGKTNYNAPDGNGYCVSQGQPFEYVTLTIQMDCDGSSPNLPNPSYMICYGFSCDGFHPLNSPSQLQGDRLTDFQGNYNPCYYDTRTIQLNPSQANILVNNYHLNGQNGSCDFSLDFDFISFGQGDALDASLTLIPPAGCSMVPGQSVITVHKPNNTLNTYNLSQYPSFWSYDLQNNNYQINFESVRSLMAAPLLFNNSGIYYSVHIVYHVNCSPGGSGTFSAAITDLHARNTCGGDFTGQPVAMPGINLNQLSCQPLTPTYTVNNPSCNNTSSGSITITSPGTSFSWNTIPVRTGSTLSNVPAGTYTCTVTYQGGCTTTVTATLTYQNSISATTTISNVNCTTGAATVTVNTTPAGTYNYAWSNQATGSPVTLSPGVYTCTITGNGCSTTVSVDIKQPLSVQHTVGNPIQCNGGATTVTISPINGYSPYQYVPLNTNGIYTNVLAGVNTYTVIDAQGCTAITSFTITQPLTLSATATYVQGSSCNNWQTGSVSITVSGGVSAYTVNGTQMVGTSITLSSIQVGNRQFTVTDHNGCSVITNQVNIPFNTPIAVTATATNGCNNGQGSAIATAQGGTNPPGLYTVLWSNGSNFASVINLNDGVYTVTFTNSSGCTGSATVTISSFSQKIPIITGSVSNCKNDPKNSNIYTIANYDGSLTYQWSAVDVDGNSLAVTPDPAHPGTNQYAQIAIPDNQGAVITVTVTDAQGICTVTSTLYVQPCCEGDAGSTTFYDGKRSSSIGTSLSNQTINVNGTFIIDNNFQLTSCTFYMASGSRILIEQSKKLTIIDGKYTAGCCRMWKGIEMEVDARIDAQMATIEYAEYGVHVNDKCQYRFSKNMNFRNDYIGLNLDCNALLRLNSQYIAETNFFTDFISPCGDYQSFPPNYLGQTTQPYVKSFAGIYSSEVFLLDLTNSVSPVNNITFTRLNNGIISYNNSVIRIQNVTFQNILSQYQYASLIPSNISSVIKNGSCIINTNSGTFSLQGYGNLPNSLNVFNTCNYGVSFANCGGYVQNCKGVNMGYGVNILRHKDIYIEKNLFNCKLYGIKSYAGIGLLTVDNNSITVNYGNINGNFTPASSAIDLNNVSSPATSFIWNNKIYLQKCRLGVSVRNCYNSTVKENEINMLNLKCFIGIEQTNSAKGYVRCNTINGNISGNTFAGIVSTISHDYEIGCNYTYGQKIGFYFNQPCLNTLPIANEMHHHFNGWLEKANGNLGIGITPSTQFLGNNWHNRQAGGVDYQFNDCAWVGSNKIITDGINPENYPTIGGPCIPGSLKGTAPGNDRTCTAYLCQPTPPGSSTTSPIDIEIAESDTIPSDYEEETNKTYDLNLFERIIYDSTLLQNPIINAFYQQKYHENIGLFVRTEVDLKEASKWDNLYLTVYNNNNYQISWIADSIVTLDSIYQADLSAYNLIFQIDSLNSVIKSLKESNNAIDEIEKQIIKYRIQNKLQDLSQIDDQPIYDNNRKIVDEILYNTIGSGTYQLNQDQISALESIIYQCPLAAGPSIYLARGLYELVNDTIIFDDEDLCIAAGTPFRKSNSNSEITLFPNPTSTRLYIKADEDILENSQFSFVNSIGKTLLKGKLMDLKDQGLSIDQFPNGIYSMIITLENRTETVKKIVILH